MDAKYYLYQKGRINMRRIIITTALLMMTGMNLAHAEQLDAAAVKALYNDQTVNAFNLIKDIESTTYFNPNGKFYGTRDDSIFQGEWEVKDDGNICLTFANGKTRCRLMQKIDGTYYKVKVKGNGKIKRILEYKSFTKGNPNNFKWSD